MKLILRRIFILIFPVFFVSCGAYFNQPFSQQKARLGEISPSTLRLANLPPPVEPIIVGVYNFKDQTGQYKPTDLGSTFSTAITQGATTILIKSLEDSKWFRPIERENLGNLLNERNIIRTTREEYRNPNDTVKTRLKPLLFAGILMEGGIISYDSNILTGGAGARYFGIGASTQYRQDRITVYLRAVSTSTGEVLKTVYVSKTILSQAVDAGLFRYVNFQRLLEVETGFTKNEPTQLAVKEAIEKAVETLIVEGIQDNLWSTKEGTEKNQELVDDYKKEKDLEASTGLYERRFLGTDFRSTFNFSLGAVLVDGDYSSAIADFKGQLGYKYHFTPSLAAGLDVQFFRLNSTPKIRNWWVSENLNLEYSILPFDRLSPYIYAGGGIMNFADNNSAKLLKQWDVFYKTQYGIGLDYKVSPRTSFNVNAEYNTVFSDKIDNLVHGKRNDNYFNFGFGINYNFGGPKIVAEESEK